MWTASSGGSARNDVANRVRLRGLRGAVCIRADDIRFGVHPMEGVLQCDLDEKRLVENVVVDKWIDLFQRHTPVGWQLRNCTAQLPLTPQ